MVRITRHDSPQFFTGRPDSRRKDAPGAGRNGSMQTHARNEKARAVARHVLNWLAVLVILSVGIV
ncbi:MAG TPA: hypothetical protein VIL32_07960 [Steroidobacteraceae bacterium]